MTPTPTRHDRMEQDVKGMETPLSPPASSIDEDAIDQDEKDEDDLYATSTNDHVWKVRRDSSRFSVAREQSGQSAVVIIERSTSI